MLLELCLQPERYVPGSPIFRDSSPTPDATPTTPITAAPSAAAAAATTTRNKTGASPTSRSRGQGKQLPLALELTQFFRQIFIIDCTRMLQSRTRTCFGIFPSPLRPLSQRLTHFQ